MHRIIYVCIFHSLYQIAIGVLHSSINKNQMKKEASPVPGALPHLTLQDLNWPYLAPSSAPDWIFWLLVSLLSGTGLERGIKDMWEGPRRSLWCLESESETLKQCGPGAAQHIHQKNNIINLSCCSVNL